MRDKYIRDYGGPETAWPENTEPDWAALYPIPEARRIKDEPSEMGRHAQATAAAEPGGPYDLGDMEDYDDDDIDDDGFWLSPRMACRLHFAGCLYVDVSCRMDPDGSSVAINQMPPVVQPYAKDERWMEAYSQAAMRLVKRLEKGVPLRPNCTAEEFALHMIIGMAKDCWEDGSDEPEQEAIEDLPRSMLDEDFDRVLEAAFDDEDVMMLFDMPQLIHPNAMLVQMMGFGNLHPKDWFKPFDRSIVSNHA